RAQMHTVLVIGGSGFFGQRICKELSRTSSIRLLIGGRTRDRVVRTAGDLGLSAEQAVLVDANDRNLSRELARLAVDTVIHTAGPFQGQHYAVASAAIEVGCHYVDLADGREFVGGIQRLDASARRRGVSVISGASTVPALSAAVIDHYRAGFERLEA